MFKKLLNWKPLSKFLCIAKIFYPPFQKISLQRKGILVIFYVKPHVKGGWGKYYFDELTMLTD